MKSLLLISRHSPYGGSYAAEALDIALSAAAFDIAVSLLFMDDGVYQLCKNQTFTSEKNTRNLESVLAALPLYDIHQLWIENESIAVRGMTQADLAHKAEGIGSQQIAELLHQFDQVLTI